MELPPALAARLGAREAARREVAASLRQQRSNAGDAEEDISADLSKWREAATALEREARQAGAPASKSKSKTSADAPSTNSTSFDLDALSARLSELERQAALLAARVGRSREGETILAGAASAREALRRARAGATPAFSLAAAAGRGAEASGGKAGAKAKEEEEEEKKKEKERSEEAEAEAKTTASRVADGARDAARLAGLRGETLRLSAASLGVCGGGGSGGDSRCPSSSSSSSSSALPSSSLPSLRLEDLEDCCVVVEATLGALVASGLKRCVVFLACAVGGGGGGSGGGGEKSGRGQNSEGGGGRGGGAVLVDGASASTFFLPAHQCRLHRLTEGCEVFVRSAAPPVLEACSALRLGPYPVSAPSISSSTSPSGSGPVLPASEASLLAAGLGSEDARRSWSRPRDFSWPLAAAGRPSPHWRRVPAAERRAPPTAAGVEAAPLERLFPAGTD